LPKVNGIPLDRLIIGGNRIDDLNVSLNANLCSVRDLKELYLFFSFVD